MIGYKVMALSEDEKEIISGANKALRFPIDSKEISMPGNGIYLSLSKQYVIDYYSELSEKEVLLTLEFDETKINFGDITDRETEIAVNKVNILEKEILRMEE